MNESLNESAIVRALAGVVVERITRRVIRDLQRMDVTLTTGDADVLLTSSDFWMPFEPLLQNPIHIRLAELTFTGQLAMDRWYDLDLLASHLLRHQYSSLNWRPAADHFRLRVFAFFSVARLRTIPQPVEGQPHVAPVSVMGDHR